MNPIQIKIELPDAVNDALRPLSERIGNTLSSLWDITFGWIDNADKKLQYKRLIALEKFKESIESGVSKIPPEDLCEPKISVVGPAMDASKYYFEEELPRKMFASLIVNSMNSKKQELVHRGYVEIIKQLSPEDALVLKNMFPMEVVPAASLSIVMHYRGMHAVGTPPDEKISPFVVVENIVDKLTDRQHSISMDNLRRLGLINLSDYELVGDSIYDFVRTSDEYSKMKNLFDDLDSNGENPKLIHIWRKNYHFTSFGEAFCEIVFN